MAHSSLRKPLALAAVLATSVGAVLGLSATADATSYGNPGSPVTVTADGAINVVGGPRIALPAGARDVSWSGQSGRFAFIGGDNGIYTLDYNGQNLVKIAQGTNPSHTVWDVSSLKVYWTEGTGASARIVGVHASGSDNGYPNAIADAVQPAPAGLGLSNADIAADFATSMVFQTTDAAGNNGISVAWWNTAGQQVVTEVVAPGDAQNGGTAPTISADGKTIVFVRTWVDGTKQLFAVGKTGDASWSQPTEISQGGGDHTDPIFEGDGKTIAFRGADGTYQFAMGSPETKISDLTGGLAVRTDSPAFLHRLGGFDRFETATKVSQMSFRDNGDAADHRGQAKAVVLTRSDQFADALGGAALASHLDAPLLLTETASLNDWSRKEIQRVLPAGGTVYVLGGVQAVSPTVVNQLGALGYKVQRIGGYDRFETAVNMADVYAPNAGDVLVATGMNFPDALSAGAAAANFSGMAVVLTDDATMPEATYRYLAAKGQSNTLKYVGAVGGQAAKALRTVTDGQFDDLAGADRYATSYNVASHLWAGFGAVGLATGVNWPDSLAGGALMGRAGGPLVLVDPVNGISPQEYQLFDANRGSDNYGYVFGGEAALPSRIDNQLAAAIDTATGSSQDSGAKTQARLSTPNLVIK